MDGSVVADGRMEISSRTRNFSHMLPATTALRGQNAELLNVKLEGTYTYHWAFKN
jgi:hypothetical protein